MDSVEDKVYNTITINEYTKLIESADVLTLSDGYHYFDTLAYGVVSTDEALFIDEAHDVTVMVDEVTIFHADNTILFFDYEEGEIVLTLSLYRLVPITGRA